MCLTDTGTRDAPSSPMSSELIRFVVRLLAILAIGTGLSAATGISLVEVSISPESRVKAAEGDALRELVQGEWREFDIVINNTAGITSPLQIESENFIPEAPGVSGRDQWLRLELVPQGPLTGKRSESRKLRLWTNQTGVRSAVLNVNAGQGTQDLGFRSDVLLNFKIKPANNDAEGARREALNWFRLFTRLPMEAPCELQAEMLDLSLEVYQGWIIQPEPDPEKTAAWLEKLRALGAKTRAILGTTRVEWRGDSLALVEASPIPLTAGLKHVALLDVTNRSADVVLLVPAWSGWKGPVAEGIDLQPGESMLTWASLEVADAQRKTSSLTLVRQNVKPETRLQANAAITVSQPATLKGRLIEGSTGEVFPGRVHVLGSDGLLRHGKAYADNITLSSKTFVPLMFAGHAADFTLPFFYSDGTFEINVPAGRTKLTLERGYEHPFVSETVDLEPGEIREITLSSQRFLDMKSLGWISGDTHIHWAKNWWSENEDLGLLKIVQRAEDLRVANNLTLKHHTKDQNFIAPTQFPMGPIPGMCDGDYHAEMAEEYRNEEFYGHIILLNIKRLIEPISTGFMGGPPFWDWPHNLPAIQEARSQGGIVIEAHGLGRNNDVPVNVAQDMSDSLDQLEPDDYYRFLDCGFRVPLSNGSDHPARVAGICRVYVKTVLPFTYQRWIDGMRNNRTFTTSGPLLFLTVNGKDIGEVLDVKPGTPLKIEARAVSRNPIGALQIISNGMVLAQQATDEREAKISFDHIAGEPLWIVARASRSASFNALSGPDIAHTSATYVNVDGKSRFRREAVEEWIKRMEIHAADMEKNGRFPTDGNRREAVGHVRAGIAVYQNLIAAHQEKSTSRVDFDIRDESGKPLAARIHLADSAGKPVDPSQPELPFWHDHFVCDGSAGFSLADGTYHYQIEKGPEWKAVKGEIVVKGDATPVAVKLSRLVDMPAEGWWAGETHIHRDPAQLPLLMRAEDLWIAQANTWWNDGDAWAGKSLPADPVSKTADGRFYNVLAGEDERGGGALLMFGLKAPLPLAGFPEKTREWPLSLHFLDMAKKRGAWVDAEKPFWQDFPIWLASGKIDSIGVAHNHMHRSGVLDNEAWGNPRDLAKYPGPHGNGLWTHDLYFRALNCGLRIPPSAGSASGVLPNPVGYNRMYVHTGEKLDWKSWWDGFKAGRTFVSNGPLLRLTADGALPGEVFKTKSGPLQVLIAGKLESPDPIKSVELIRNGRSEIITLPSLVTINESGWFAVRAIADVDHTFRFAMTAPWYVELGGEKMKPVKEDAEFFLDWTRRRIEQIKTAIPEGDRQKSALASLAAAVTFWQDKAGSPQVRTRVRGHVMDAESKSPMPARIYIQNADGAWFFPESEGGTAARYEKRNSNNPLSVENHTTLSAHPWTAELPPGRYSITIERGKEWRSLHREIVVAAEPVDLELPLERWVDMAAEGWFSGETHVHRTLADLPNVMLAEDLNVAFPLTYWCLDGTEIPYHFDKEANPDQEASLISVDASHVIWPCNTEWEIFGIGGHEHTLGAVFALGHRTPFKLNAPPLGPVVSEARKQGAMLDMDKPDWPWAMALPPVMGVDLFELSNNHIWRVPFALTQWFTPAPEWMLPGATKSGTERDWIEYTHRSYWAMLNCGQRLQPSAGTASGVHPVPLGYSRVYVNCPDGFSYANWRAGLQAGRSFVTTGPMLNCTVRRDGSDAVIETRVRSQTGTGDIEIIVNGEIHEIRPVTGNDTTISCRVPLDGTSWIAVRAWEPQPDKRFRFAHSAPVWFDDPQKPLRPLKREAEFLAGRVRDEITRSREILPSDALTEFQQALAEWERAVSRAR